MLAYDYPILGLFWTMLLFFLWVAWFVLLFRVIADIFRAHDMGGWAKAVWCIFVIFVPFLGVLVYLIVHGGDMAHRDARGAQASEAATEDYIRQVAGTGTSSADELTKLSALFDEGVITREEFEQQKAKVLA